LSLSRSVPPTYERTHPIVKYLRKVGSVASPNGEGLIAVPGQKGARLAPVPAPDLPHASKRRSLSCRARSRYDRRRRACSTEALSACVFVGTPATMDSIDPARRAVLFRYGTICSNVARAIAGCEASVFRAASIAAASRSMPLRSSSGPTAAKPRTRASAALGRPA